MKRFVLGICIVSTLTSYSALADGFHVLNGSSFTAPNVNGDTNIGNPQTGDIVFDTSTANFFGYSGSSWIQFGPLSLGSQGKFTTFTSSGTFTTQATSSASTVYKYLVIGGGGGGGGSNNAYVTGIGGGAGGIAEGTFTGVSPSTNITITIGAGGPAGSTVPTAGGSGGTSSIGAPVSVSCTGGAGGNSTTGTVVYASGGTCTGGAINVQGSPGTGGIGGSGIFGGSGIPNGGASSPTPGNAYSYGAGGGGGSSAISGCAGGTGFAGLVTITQLTP